MHPRRAGLRSRIEIAIRKATLSDLQVIAEFNRRLAEETEDLRLEPSVVTTGVEALLRDPAKGIYFVADCAGKVVGQLMITYEWSDWRNGNLWWIQSVYVSPEFRGRGVFQKLFEHVHALAREEQHVRALRLYMHDENDRARRTYERLGMRLTHYVVFDREIPMGAEAGGHPGSD